MGICNDSMMDELGIHVLMFIKFMVEMKSWDWERLLRLES